MTRQPDWRFVANLGDASPIEHGGYFVFVDATGVYPAEGEMYDPRWNIVYRIQLDQMYLHNGHLIPRSIWDTAQAGHRLPHPLESYVEWFDDDIESVGASVDLDPDELRRLFCSDDPKEQAWAYHELYKHFGWDNGDGYPLELTQEEAKERYKGLY